MNCLQWIQECFAGKSKMSLLINHLSIVLSARTAAIKKMATTFRYQHSFFGLGLNYKPILHEEIFALIYHSHGGFNWSDVYEMPIWLRKFYIKSLIEVRTAENKSRSSTNNTKRIQKPSFVGKNK